MRKILLATLLMGVAIPFCLADRTAMRIQPADQYSYTSFPLYGAVVTPSDTTNLTEPGVVRANAEGAVTAICYGNTSSITLDLAAGEYFPCLVKRVLDTGTDSIALNVFY